MQAMQARLNEMEKRLYDMNQKEEPESIENGKKRRRRAGEIVKNFHVTGVLFSACSAGKAMGLICLSISTRG